MTSTHRVGGYCFAAVLAVYVSTTGGSFATDLASYEVTKNLVEHGSVAMSSNLLNTDAERGVDGRYYAPVGIGHPLFGVPFYMATRLFGSTTGMRLGKPDSLTKAGVVAGSTVAAAGCVYLTFLFAVRIGGLTLSRGRSRSLRSGIFTALVLAFGTTLWPYSKFGFNAPLAALCLMGAAYGAWLGVRRRQHIWLVLGGVSLGCAVLTRHEMSLGIVPVALWLWLEAHGDHRAFLTRGLLFGTPVVISAGLWMLYNYARFGQPFDTGLLRDPNVSFDTPLLVGLYGLLASPGRSLLLYAPAAAVGVVALFSLARTDRSTALFLAAFPLVFLPVYSKMRQWDGGESYGPRYLVPVVAFLILPLAHWFGAPAPPSLSRRLIVLVFAMSIAVQLPGVLVDFSKAQQAYAHSKANYSIDLTRYTWEGAPLMLNTRAALQAIPRNVRYLTGQATPPAVGLTAGEEARDFSQQFAFSLDFWWLYLYYLGAVSASAALGLGAVPLLIALGCGLRIRQLLGADERRTLEKRQ